MPYYDKLCVYPFASSSLRNSCYKAALRRLFFELLNTKFWLALRLVAPDPAILLVAVAALVYFAKKRRRSCLSSCRTEASKPNLQSLTSEVEENKRSTLCRNGDENTAPANASPSDSAVDIPPGEEPVVSRDNKTFSPNANALLSHGRRVWNAWALNTCNVLLTVFLTGAAGIIVPSVLSLFYLLMFLGMCTYWASRHKVHSQEFMYLRIAILIYSGLHLCVYFLYQFPCAQMILDDSDLITRLLGLSYLVRSDCNRSGENIFPTDKPLFVFFAPVATLFLYYTVAMQLRPWLSNKIKDRKFYWLFEEPFNPPILRRSVIPTFRQRTLTRRSSSQAALPVHDSEPNLAGLQEPLISCTESQLPSPTTAAAFTIPANTAVPSQSEANTVVVSVHAPIARLSSVDLVDPLMATNTAAAATYSTSFVDNNEIVPANQLQRTTDDAGHGSCLRGSSISHGDAQAGTTPVPAVPSAKTKPTFAFSPHLFPLIAHGPLLLSIHNSVIRNSYVLTFIAMMAWSVFFRSWLSFILLVSACILWILPNSRSACLICSPLIVAYGMCIILLQYVYCFNLSEAELPTYINHLSINLTEVGLHRWSTPVGPLALQLCFLIFFWLNLRLFTVERMAYRRGLKKLPSRNGTAGYQLQDVPNTTATIMASKAAWQQTNSSSLPTLIMQTRPHTVAKPTGVRGHIDGDMVTTTTATAATISSSFPALNEAGLEYSFIPPTEPASPGNLGPGITIVDDERYTRFTNFLYLLCVRYWIALCCLTMLVLSLRPPVVIFRIGYMLHLLYFFTLFMISYKLWQKQIIAFWWFAIGYSMVVLLCTYTYQFTSFPYYWQNGTGLSPQILKALGLEQFGSAELFDRMMMPVVFLVIIILQVHYFHRPSSLYTPLHQRR
ncbi:unnamed protein product [Schistocephalus solidus]|uniref:Piezo-type mechanosensitive ion channel component n=1 Tax=Schistocephalus solidus TaxID=70667 RepID=A0A183T6D2_SCHSO|nr:unnamed protein product [Schistocephalus solidus]